MTKNIKLFTLLILLIAFDASAVSCLDFTGQSSVEGDVSLSVDLTDKIRALENDYGKGASLTSFIIAESVDVKMSISNLKSRMTKRETYLWGWLAKLLGGDVQKINELKTRESRLEQVNKALENESEADQRRDRVIVDSVNQYLRNADERFNAFRSAEEKLYRVICNGNQCMASVEKALTSIERVQGGFFKNPDLTAEDVDTNFINQERDSTRLEAQVAHSQVSSARLSLIGAKDEARLAFEDALSFHEALGEAHRATALAIDSMEAPVKGPIEFVFQAFLSLNIKNGLSHTFAQVFKSFKFEGVGSKLEDLHTEVREQTDQAVLDYEKLKNELDEQACRARELCR